MSGRISQAIIDDLLSRTDIIEIIQPRISLVKKGQNYQARCPFHDEKTPSFTVSQPKQFYYCFGCGANGNAISFLMNYDHMEFLDTLSYLAAQAGIELQRDDEPAPDPTRQALYPLMEKVAAFYQKALRQSPDAITYLKNRHLTGQTAKTFGIGYAPPNWDNLSHAVDRGATQSLITAGMQIRKETGKTYDRFRHRIMFPIRDIRGRIIAFGGRSLGDDLPKYLNSPETTIFHKSNELYGLYEARKANSPLSRLLIVEGYMDVIGLAQQNVNDAVATLGTAINSHHIQKCLRYTNDLIFCFDGDNAGRKAAWKSLTMALPLLRDDIQLRFLFLPEGEDPDSLIQQIGKAAFEKLINQSDALSDVFFNTLSKQLPITSMDTKAQYAHHAMKHLNTMPNGIFHQLMKKKLAEHLSVNQQELESPKPITQKASQRPKPQTRLNPAQLSCALLLQHPELAETIDDIGFLDTIPLDGTTLLRDLICMCKKNPQINAGKLLASPLAEEQKQHIAELAAVEFPMPKDGLQSEFQGAMDRLKERHIKQQMDHLIRKARKTELSLDEKQQLQALLAHKIKPND
jgi:DNA primase